MAPYTVTGIQARPPWTHPQRGVIQPVQFIAMAEEAGLLEELDLAAIDAAARALQYLTGLGHDRISVSVNLSFQTLANPGLQTRLAWAAEMAGVVDNRFALEVQESVLPGGPSHDTAFVDGLNRLAEAGFAAYLDDFGVGYAGLSHLARLPVSGLKIDRSLVRAVMVDPASAAIVRYTLNLARELGLRTVAEGVESAEIAEFMRMHGCDAIQGFGVARPMPLSDLADWLDTPPILLPASHRKPAIA